MEGEDAGTFGLVGIAWFIVLLASLSWWTVAKSIKSYRDSDGLPMWRGKVMKDLEAAAFFTAVAGLASLAAWMFVELR